MRNLEFDANAFEDLSWWVNKDRKIAIKILKTIQEIQREPFKGTGKPEPLKGNFSGAWSRSVLHQSKTDKRQNKNEFFKA